MTISKHSAPAARFQSGFSLLELMITVAVIGILASMAMSAYQDYMIRAQVTEGLTLGAAAKTPIVDSFLNDGEAPVGRAEAGMSVNAADTAGKYVQSVAVTNGVVVVQFGYDAHQLIQNLTLTLTPYATAGGDVAWRCGNAPIPGGLGPGDALGTITVYIPPTLPNEFMPATCRS